jgi:hypothetical protein
VLLTASETCGGTLGKENASCLAFWNALPDRSLPFPGEVEASFPDVRVRITKDAYCAIANTHWLSPFSSCEKNWDFFLKKVRVKQM